MSAGCLRGSRWILTRPRNRSESWCEALEKQGAEVLLAPALLLVEGENGPVRSSLKNLTTNGLLIFTSATTVHHFFSLLGQEEKKLLGSFRWVGVGPATANAIRDCGFEVVVEGSGKGADELADLVIAKIPCCEAIHYTSDAGLSVMVDRLKAAKYRISRVEASKTRIESDLDPLQWQVEVPNRWSGIVFSSPASVRAIVERSGEILDSLLRIPAVAAGKTTADELRKQGWAQIEIAENSTPTDLVVACTNLLGGGTMEWTG